jgi:hypothetical protein
MIPDFKALRRSAPHNTFQSFETEYSRIISNPPIAFFMNISIKIVVFSTQLWLLFTNLGSVEEGVYTFM